MYLLIFFLYIWCFIRTLHIDLVSARHRETKRHYALYNTLSDVQMYLNKELSLLSSILDAYPEYVVNQLCCRIFFISYTLINLLNYRAEKSPESKEQFLRQLENIDVSVKQTLDRVSYGNSFCLIPSLVMMTT